MFINSSYDDWQKITAPKILGAWNMHKLCPDLDFFVILASAAGALGRMYYRGIHDYVQDIIY
jgi:hypothetical protein